MGETAQEPQTTQEEKTQKPVSPQLVKPKTNKKPIIVTIVVAVVLIITSAAGIYFWQQSKVRGVAKDKDVLEDKVASQSAQLATLKKDKADLESRVNFLEKSLKEATASTKFELGELSISSANAKHFTAHAGGFNEPLVWIDVTMKNSTDHALYLSLFNFKLKDSQNKSYPFAQEGTYDLPSGKVNLFDQQMSPSETVSGTLVFKAPKSINLFTLLYNEQQLTITAK